MSSRYSIDSPEAWRQQFSAPLESQALAQSELKRLQGSSIASTEKAYAYLLTGLHESRYGSQFKAKGLFDSALACFRTLGNTQGQLRCQIAIAVSVAREGNLRDGIGQLTSLLSQHEQELESIDQAIANMSYATLFSFFSEEYEISFRHSYKALEAVKTASCPALHMQILNNLASTHLELGNFTEARKLYTEAWMLNKSNPVPRIGPIIASNLVSVLQEGNARADDFARLLPELELHDELDIHGRAAVPIARGFVFIAIGDYDAAEREVDAAYKTLSLNQGRDPFPTVQFKVRTLWIQSLILQHKQQFDAALITCQQALEELKNAPLMLFEQGLSLLAADLCATVGRHEEAQVHLRNVIRNLRDKQIVAARSAAFTMQIQYELREVRRERDEALLIANTDSLTGLPNRHSTGIMVPELLTNAKKAGRTAYVVLLDLDDFRLINHEFGHPFGDRILQDFATTLRSDILSADFAGRWEGEAFCLLFSGIDVATLESNLTKLQTQVSQLRWCSETPKFLLESILDQNSRTLLDGCEQEKSYSGLSFTASWVEAGVDADSFHTLLEQADKRLSTSRPASKATILRPPRP